MARRPRKRTLVQKSSSQVASRTPAAIEAALDAEGMNSTAQLGPGRPMNPVWGYSTRPRAMDYPTGANITTGNNRAAWGRTTFDVLKGIIDAYDVARIAINHKIDELRSMEPLFLPVDGFSGDADGAIDAARTALEFPDRDLPFDAWLSKWLEGVLRYDAGTLYRRRNYDGQVIGLDVIDGTTIYPLVDEHGRKPSPPAPAWFQSIKGQSTKWFTTDDLVPTVFRPQADSPFGLAPIESVLLTVNTDLKHQWHFLQMFTEGSIPGGFIEAPPDVSSPDQVDEWQQYWDATVMGDAAKLHQLIVVPAGTKVTETRPKAFDKTFPQYLMMRTAAAFGVVPQDLGFVDDVNRANGETQTDVQFRVNTLPWVRFVEGVLSRYLRRDLGLPVQVKLDTGRDVVDRESEARAHDIYVKMGAESVDEVRTNVLGLPIDNERPAPRFIHSTRTGPVPLRSLYAIAGPVDPETGSPAEGAPLDVTPYDGAGGVIADKLPGSSAFHRAPTDPDDPTRPQLEHEVPGSDVAGLAVPPPRTSTEGAGQPVAKAAADAELASFRRFVRARGKAGRWRDFTFTTVDTLTAHRLNQHARARLKKAAGHVVAAGLAVIAADTGRVLMLQRALDPTDPAAGTWEFPGGCLDDGEEPAAAALREFAEETGLTVPDGTWAGSWLSPTGVYAGHVLVVLSEQDVPIFGRAAGTNPDDPDGDAVEVLAWWDPATLGANPAIRPELGVSWEQVLDLLEEATADPKALVSKSWRDGPDTHPVHAYDLRITDHYAPLVADALGRLFTSGQLTAAVQAAAGIAAEVRKDDDAEAKFRDRVIAAARDTLGDGDSSGLEQVLRQIIADGYTAGGWAAAGQLPGGSGAAVTPAGVTGIDWDRWEPGHVDAAIQTADGALAAALDDAGIGVKGIVGTTLDQLGNRIADGLLDGASIDDVGRSLRDLLGGDADRAELIAHTETARAMDLASMDTYAAAGISEFDVITSAGACPRCLDAAAANPHPVSDGGLVPLHPRCRCASAPHVTY